LAGGILALGLVNCGGGESKSLSDVKNATPSDSLSYYLGEMQASQYFGMCQQDSTIKRKGYEEGLMKGLELLRDDDDSYNAGLMQGIQLAAQLKGTQKEMSEIQFSKSLFQSGFNYALTGDSIRNLAEDQTAFQNVMRGMSARQEVIDSQKISDNIAEYIKKNPGFEKIGENEYIKVVKPGSGETLQNGDSITYTLKMASADGKDLSRFNLPDNHVVIGKTLTADYPYASAIMKMKPGETANIIISAKSLFNNYVSQVGLKSTDFLVLTVIISPDVKKVAIDKPAAEPVKAN
jgi:hypothetical protein